MRNLGKIKLLPAREQVASVLRKAILSRELKEGEELTLEGTAQMIGVSSTPVREAFQILARDGLIKLRPNKGAIVLGVNEKTIRDHYETRALLEAETAARASEKERDISSIIAAYELSEKAMKENDTATYSDCNQAFHMGIWEIAGNKKMQDILSSLWNGFSMGHRITEEEYAKISIAEHRQILDALIAHDRELARSRMYRHIIRSMENILTRYEGIEE